MNKLIVEPSPHIRSENKTRKIMLHVIIALLPVLAASSYIFGPRALILTAVCVISCIVFEFLFKKITKREQTVSDLSAVITGMLLAFNLPVTLPIYAAIIGCFVAIVIVKQMFGGIGQNFANPAITARIVLTLSFTAQMSYWVKPFYYSESITDSVTSATPLALGTGDKTHELTDLLFGFHAGSLGETCSVAILLGFIYLLVTRVISPVTPVVFIGVVAIGAFIGEGDVLREVLSGGLLLGAIFMATDYSTTPLTQTGKMIFGIGCGLITLVIRGFGGMPEGVSFSILIMNILTPYIDKATRTRPFGSKKA